MLTSSDLYHLPADAHATEFDARALALFREQFQQNELYGRWCRLLNKTPENTHTVEAIPFLPVQFFKSHDVKTGHWKEEAVFTSSTTTGGEPSMHPCADLNGYLTHTVQGFERHYGPLSDWVVLALLPSYLERTGSSLVAMAEHWVNQSGQPESGFYLYDHAALLQQLQKLQAQGRPTLLLGVTFALLDFAELLRSQPLRMPTLRIMETGGMKARGSQFQPRAI